MFRFKTAAIACGLALTVGAFATTSVQEIYPQFDIFASNSLGSLAGRKQTANDRERGAFSLFGITFLFDAPGADWTNVLDVNNRMEMIGQASYNGDLRGFYRPLVGKVKSYLYPGSSQTIFNSINDDGDILGWHYTNDNHHGAFLLHKGGEATEFVVDGYEDGSWYRMNDRDQFLGSQFIYGSTSFKFIGLLASPGKVEEIRVPGFTNTFVIELNNRGEVLGEGRPAYGEPMGSIESIAFLRRANGTYVPLDYQPNWSPKITQRYNHRNYLLKFNGVLGTVALALDDEGRAIISCRALYTHYGPLGPVFSEVKERTFAIRP